mmetsp:Transcript_30815/g.65519  ORF Transcript_30815/g.65519 Transcript_30815/m.65519 type:complete len:237 (+) Transcript_30815:547-1257(+)
MASTHRSMFAFAMRTSPSMEALAAATSASRRRRIAPSTKLRTEASKMPSSGLSAVAWSRRRNQRRTRIRLCTSERDAGFLRNRASAAVAPEASSRPLEAQTLRPSTSSSSSSASSSTSQPSDHTGRCMTPQSGPAPTARRDKASSCARQAAMAAAQRPSTPAGPTRPEGISAGVAAIPEAEAAARLRESCRRRCMGQQPSSRISCTTLHCSEMWPEATADVAIQACVPPRSWQEDA